MEQDLPTAVEIAERVRQGRISSEEIVLDTFRRIDALEPGIHAFLHLDRDGALARARSIDRQVGQGNDPGPLAGVPIAIKDNICTSGMPTTAASRILQGYRPPYDATVVQRIRDAGGIPIGKTNLDEFGMGSSCEHSAFGPTRNPWDRERVPGGSSGGSAAAVSAGMAPLALGSDTGGSIRQPAALCGVVGLKPTYGLVSRYGLIAFASSLDQVGPMARTVDDVTLLLEAIAGPDPRDSTASPDPVKPLRGEGLDGVKGMRIGLPREYLHGVDQAIEEKIREAANLLQGGGAQIEEIQLPLTPYGIACYYLLCTAEASSNLARYDGVHYGMRETSAEGIIDMVSLTREKGFGKEVKLRILLGTFVLSAGFYDAYYKNASRVRSKIRQEFDEAFKEVDAVIGPTSPVTAFPLGEKVEDPLKMYLCDALTVAVNLAGLPGLSLPCGLASGLPVGLQVIGRPFGEADVLRVGRFVEAGVAFPAAPPAPGEGS